MRPTLFRGRSQQTPWNSAITPPNFLVRAGCRYGQRHFASQMASVFNADRMIGRRSKVVSGALDKARLNPVCAPQEAQNPERENVLIEALCHLHSDEVARCLSTRQVKAHASENAPITLPVCEVAREVTTLVSTCDETTFTYVPTSRLRLSVMPRASNGWRSEVVFESQTTRKLSMELVSAPGDRSIAERVRRDLGERSSVQGQDAMRTISLNRLAEVDRAHSAGEKGGPDRTCEARPYRDCSSGCWLRVTDYASLFRSEESLALGSEGGHELRGRRLHIFEDVPFGTELGITTRRFQGRAPADPCVSLRSYAKRMSDGVVIAFCEAVFR